MMCVAWCVRGDDCDDVGGVVGGGGGDECKYVRRRM